MPTASPVLGPIEVPAEYPLWRVHPPTYKPPPGHSHGTPRRLSQRPRVATERLRSNRGPGGAAFPPINPAFAAAYAKKGRWHLAQFTPEAGARRRRSPGPPEAKPAPAKVTRGAQLWRKAQSARDAVRSERESTASGRWQMAIKPWLRGGSERDRQLQKARVEKLQMDAAAERKRMDIEMKGRKLLKDMDFLHRKAEARLTEERLTEHIKRKLDELGRTRRGLEQLKAGPIKGSTLRALQTVHKQMLRELFDDMDEDGGGSLDMDEIRSLARSLGSRLSQKELDAAMAEMDEDGGGSADFHEFYQWWCSEKKTSLAGADTDQAYSIVPLS